MKIITRRLRLLEARDRGLGAGGRASLQVLVRAAVAAVSKGDGCPFEFSHIAGRPTPYYEDCARLSLSLRVPEDEELGDTPSRSGLPKFGKQLPRRRRRLLVVSPQEARGGRDGHHQQAEMGLSPRGHQPPAAPLLAGAAGAAGAAAVGAVAAAATAAALALTAVTQSLPRPVPHRCSSFFRLGCAGARETPPRLPPGRAAAAAATPARTTARAAQHSSSRA